ncbi:MAG: thermonuclease family protein [Patescibacteria group bacterium]
MSQKTIITVVSLLLVFYTPFNALAMKTEVLHVIDGDTLIIKTGKKIEHIRILGIDTPELYTSKTGVAQCYARESLAEVRKIVKGNKQLDIEKDSLAKNRDAYGRHLRHVNHGSMSLSEHLVRNGFAKVYTRSPASNTQKLLTLQQEAQRTKKGLWKWCK